MTYDKKVYDLAAAMLADVEGVVDENDPAALACEIQSTIEQFIEFSYGHRAALRARGARWNHGGSRVDPLIDSILDIMRPVMDRREKKG